MKFRILSKILGLIMILISLAMGACGVFATFDQTPGGPDCAEGLYFSAGATFLFGLMLFVGGWGKITRIPRREGVMVVGLTWVLSGIFGALPYIICEPGLDPIPAFFETISGFTTTGATVIADLEPWPHGVLLWRSVTQWLGGLGILVLFIAVLSSLGAGSKSLFRNESSFQSGEASTARIRDTAQVLWRVYLMLTVICLLGLKILGMTWFDSVVHSMTAVSTAGFSPHNASIAHFSSWKTAPLIEIWLMIFMLLCSLNFLIWVVIFKKRWDRLRNEEEGRWLIVIIAGSITFITITRGILEPEGSLLTQLRETAFIVISIISTTGFGLADYDLWPLPCLITILGLMLLGGCSGSTAGGLKVGRLLVFMKTFYNEVVHAFRPNQALRLRVNGNTLDSDTRSQSVIFVAVFLVLFAAGAWTVSVLEAGTGLSGISAVGASATSLGNIGPAFGSVGPTDNYAALSSPSLMILSALMILGRLELFAFLVLFVPRAWRRF